MNFLNPSITKCLVMTLLDNPTTESVFRKISYLISALSLTLGLYVYQVLDYEPIKWIEISIGLFFLIIPSLTRWIGLYMNICFFFIVLNAALCFYGILLGPLSEIHILVAFLLGASAFLLRGKKLVLFPVSLVLSMLVFLELNYYNSWFEPLKIAYQNAIKVRWVIIFTGTSLSAVTVIYFVKKWVSEKTSKLAQKLYEANKNKTEFLSQTSHELRAPFTNIWAIVDFFNTRKSDLPEDVQSQVDHLLNSSDQALRILNNHLDLARIEAGAFNTLKPESVNLKSVINTCIAIQRSTANLKKVFLEVEIDPSLPDYIMIDPVALNSVINNLCSNVVKYTPKNRTAFIKIMRDGERIFIETKNPGSIPSERLKAIFNPYVASHEFNSTGLGLPIIKHIAQLLNGDVFAFTLGEYVIFKFELPFIYANAPKVTITKEETKGVLQAYKIMVIEDDSFFRSFLQRIITYTGAQCVLYENGIEALKKIESDVPNLILCDLTLPHITGIEFVEKIKQIHSIARIPVVFMSAKGFLTQVEVTEIGSSYCLSKPFGESSLYPILLKYLTPVRIIVKDSA